MSERRVRTEIPGHPSRASFRDPGDLARQLQGVRQVACGGGPTPCGKSSSRLILAVGNQLAVRHIPSLMIVHAKPPRRYKAAKESRAALACGFFVTSRPPTRAAASRVRFEVVKAIPVHPDIGDRRKATAEEIAECLRFTAPDHDPLMSRLAIERLLEHVQACGLVLVRDEANPS